MSEEISINMNINSNINDAHHIMKKMLCALEPEELILIEQPRVTKKVIDITMTSEEFDNNGR